MKGRGNSLEISYFAHSPLLSGLTMHTECFTSGPEIPTEADRLVLMWFKCVLVSIKTRLEEEEENKEEVIFFSAGGASC